MTIDAYNKTVRGMLLNYTDGQGVLWEIEADFEYVAGKLYGTLFPDGGLDDLRGRRTDGPMVQIHPDDGMLRAIAAELLENEEILEADAEAALN